MRDLSVGSLPRYMNKIYSKLDKTQKIFFVGPAIVSPAIAVISTAQTVASFSVLIILEYARMFTSRLFQSNLYNDCGLLFKNGVIYLKSSLLNIVTLGASSNKFNFIDFFRKMYPSKTSTT